MKFMNAEHAVETALLQWEVMKKEGCSKKVALSGMGLHEIKFHCPLCDFVWDNEWNAPNCFTCPVRWARSHPIAENTCMRGEFGDWVRDRSNDNTARMIDLLALTLDNLRKEKTDEDKSKRKGHRRLFGKKS